MIKCFPRLAILSILCTIVLCTASCRTVIADTTYRVRLLDELDGRGSVAYSINNFGHIAGQVSDWSETTSAVIWAGGPAQFAGSLGGNYSSAAAINDYGQVVGTASLPGGGWHAYLWSDGETQDLFEGSEVFSTASAVNNQGCVVGSVLDQVWSAFKWDGQLHILNPIPGSSISFAYAISNTGHIAGYSGDIQRAVFFTDEEAQVVPGSCYVLSSVNDQGHAVGPVNYASADGSIATRASLWDGSEWRDLGALGGPTPENHCSTAYAINNHGQVVGESTTDDSWQYGSVFQSAFIWENGLMQRLPSLPGYLGSVAYDINDSGTIVGALIDSSGYLQSAIWEPVPEPSSLASLLFALGGLAGAVKRRHKRV